VLGNLSGISVSQVLIFLLLNDSVKIISACVYYAGYSMYATLWTYVSYPEKHTYEADCDHKRLIFSGAQPADTAKKLNLNHIKQIAFEFTQPEVKDGP
jgi:hypothetical protein